MSAASWPRRRPRAPRRSCRRAGAVLADEPEVVRVLGAREVELDADVAGRDGRLGELEAELEALDLDGVGVGVDRRGAGPEGAVTGAGVGAAPRRRWAPGRSRTAPGRRRRRRHADQRGARGADERADLRRGAADAGARGGATPHGAARGRGASTRPSRPRRPWANDPGPPALRVAAPGRRPRTASATAARISTTLIAPAGVPCRRSRPGRCRRRRPRATAP